MAVSSPGAVRTVWRRCGQCFPVHRFSVLGAGCGAQQNAGSALPGGHGFAPSQSVTVRCAQGVQAQRGCCTWRSVSCRVMQGGASPPLVLPPKPPVAIAAWKREAPSTCGLHHPSSCPAGLQLHAGLTLLAVVVLSSSASGSTHFWPRARWKGLQTAVRAVARAQARDHGAHTPGPRASSVLIELLGQHAWPVPSACDLTQEQRTPATPCGVCVLGPPAWC